MAGLLRKGPVIEGRISSSSLNASPQPLRCCVMTSSGGWQNPGNRIQVQQRNSESLVCRRRPYVATRFQPFGRNILDESQASSAAPGSAEEQKEAMEMLAATRINSYALFIVLFMDRIYKDHTHPAFHLLATQRNNKLSVAASLWKVLTWQQKAVFYRAFQPLCSELKQQITCRNATRLGGLLQRIYQHGSTLTPQQKNAVNDVVVAAMQQRLEILKQAVTSNISASDIPNPSAPPERLLASQVYMAEFAEEVHKDEQDREALKAALDASGFKHISWMAEDLDRPDIKDMDALAQLMEQDKALAELVASANAAVSAATSAAGGGTLQDPQVKLVSHIRQQTKQDFWNDFMSKCRLAWDVFFPSSPVLSPAGAMRARLQMILVSDRSGLDLPTLMHIRNQSMSALAQTHGWDNISELQLQVSSAKQTGKVMSVPLMSIPSPYMLRNSDDYDYEYYDDDDYDDALDETKVGEILEGPLGLPAAPDPAGLLRDWSSLRQQMNSDSSSMSSEGDAEGDADQTSLSTAASSNATYKPFFH